MNSVLFLSFIFTVVLFNIIHGLEMCDFEDNECIKRGISNFYKKGVAGVPCVVKPSDPLYLDEIIGETPHLKYRLSNVTMTGLKTCKITKATLKQTGLPFEYTLLCAKLVINYNRESEGKLGPTYIDGKGLATLTAFDYELKFIGHYGEFISKKDHKAHFYIKRTRIETDAKGKLLYEATGLNKDKTKSDQAVAYMNSHPDLLEEFLQDPVMPNLLAVVVKNLDIYIRTLREEEVFPK